jgi:type IV pilus assembly protein PilW
MNAMNTRIRHKHQLGLSLIELMIAIVIGVLLMAGTAGLLISNKRIYKEQNEMGRLQENARFAMEILIRDIRRAGYAGCVDRVNAVTNHLNNAGADTYMGSFNVLVEGSEAASNWYPSNSNEAVADMVAGSDAITIKFFQPTGIATDTTMNNASAEIDVDTPGVIQPGDIIALTDCDSADIMQITGITGTQALQHQTGTMTPGNATQALSKQYQDDSSVERLVVRRYFVGTNPNTGETALFRLGPDTRDVDDIDGDGDTTEILPQEVIEGVENMQVLYGEDTAGNDLIADTYVTADAVTNWNNVVSARISLLMRTIKEDFTAPLNTNVYNLLGTAVDPNPDDHRRRRVFTSTIDIRNRSI